MNERNRSGNGGNHPGEEGMVRELLERAGPRPPIPPADLQAIKAAARSAWKARGAQSAPTPRVARLPLERRGWALALAASLAVALGVAGWSLLERAPAPQSVARVEAVHGNVTRSSPETAPAAVAPASAVGPGEWLTSDSAGGEGGKASLRLASGVVLRIDDGSRVQLASANTVHLESGALYVDTERAAGSEPAIAIHTPLGVARDIGTRFSMRLESSGEPALRVRVRDGSVAVEGAAGSHRTSAGEELLLHRDGSAEIHPAPPFGPGWGWVMEAAAAFDVEGRTLPEFLAWVHHETGWTIRYEDDELEERAPRIVLHGAIGSLRPDQAPFVLLPGALLEGELQGTTLVVRRR